MSEGKREVYKRETTYSDVDTFSVPPLKTASVYPPLEAHTLQVAYPIYRIGTTANATSQLLY
ncbi:unnamed protein product [Orchesella dallaii]|uniref:Uncharacterized protein n=1 Tax=Orchesella dallaii TaxID=48710 RepID=A0ABP1R5Y4_9HEXA